MSDELIDIFDEYNCDVIEQRMKSDAHVNGLWHRTVNVWIYNSKGEMLLQLRNDSKDVYPNLWDISVAGHIAAGEEPGYGAVREVGEEIGLSIGEGYLEFHRIRSNSGQPTSSIYDNEFAYVYLLRFDGDVSELTIQTEELQEVKFVSLEELEKDLYENSGNYIPHPDYRYEMIGQVRQRI